MTAAMRTYTHRELRAADLFAMVLAGAGAVLLLSAAVPLLLDGGAANGMGSPVPWALGGVFFVLGVVLNFKVKQLQRSGGREADGD